MTWYELKKVKRPFRFINGYKYIPKWIRWVIIILTGGSLFWVINQEGIEQINEKGERRVIWEQSSGEKK